MAIKKLVSTLFLLLLILTLIFSFNWFNAGQQKQDIMPAVSLFSNDESIATTLSNLIQFRTVSNSGLPENTTQNAKLIKYLELHFDSVFKNLTVKYFDDNALLLTWPGKNPQLNPAMFNAHFDVVTTDESKWQYAPFSGKIDNSHVWGRGALDDKSAITSILHALTKLIETNYQPERTLYFAFGGDEEIGGHHGAKQISEHLASSNVELGFLLDEGMPITVDIMKGVDKPVAMIGIAEKGYANIQLTTKTSGGHSSSPPAETAIGILASAISKIEARPMEKMISKPIAHLFNTLAPDMKPLQGIVVSNLWATESLLTGQLEKHNSTNALIRTTLAPTMISGSKQANVLARQSSAIINTRVLPGNTINQVVNHIKQTINDERIEISILGTATEPSSVSSISSAAYKNIETAIKETFSDVLVAPSLLIASTDTKHYAPITENVYRFRPLWIKKEDIERFHGANERISIDNLKKMTMFYHQLIQKSGSSE